MVVCQVLRVTLTNKTMQCPKCKGEMGQGCVADYAGLAALVASSHAGQPRKKLIGHTQAPRDKGVPIGALRCQGCGFLEFYADARFAAQESRRSAGPECDAW